MKVDKVTGFKIKFDIRDYADILPMPPEEIDEIINWDKVVADCKWEKKVPTQITARYIEQETTRCLKTGVWIFIKHQLVWLPPNYYFFLQYGSAGGEAPKFRLKRLKHVYFKLRVRNNPKAIGTYTIKCRQDGETTMAIHDALWECMDGNMNTGQIGIQSKTNDDAKNPCWLTMEGLWGVLPEWFKEVFFDDFASKNAMAEQIKFKRDKTEEKSARQILIKYYPSVHNAMDGKNNMRICILDEINKWKICSFYDTYINYKKFIAVGSSRRGLFNIFSSPSDTDGKHNDEAKVFWEGSNPDELTETGSTATRVFRYYSDPLDGIEGFYDDYGDADPDEILHHILMERKNMPADKRIAEIRAFPLNETEMFSSFDKLNETWSNLEGINNRMNFLKNRRFKNDITKEPCLIYGNIEWKDGIVDNPQGVVFRQADVDCFDVQKARWAFSHLPKDVGELTWVWKNDMNGHRPLPPRISENIIGIDPIDKRYVTANKGFSNGSMTNVKYLDFSNNGIVDVPTAYYCIRVQHASTFFEDAIKFAIFMQAMVQVENKNTKICDWFEDRGYFDWLLAKRGESKNSVIKGDAPGAGGQFLNEMIMLIDDATNLPLNEGDKYKLEDIWFYDLLNDISNLDPKNTQKSDGFNSWGQAMIGKTKMIQAKPQRKPDSFTQQLVGQLLN